MYVVFVHGVGFCVRVWCVYVCGVRAVVRSVRACGVCDWVCLVCVCVGVGGGGCMCNVWCVVCECVGAREIGCVWCVCVCVLFGVCDIVCAYTRVFVCDCVCGV